MPPGAGSVVADHPAAGVAGVAGWVGGGGGGHGFDGGGLEEGGDHPLRELPSGTTPLDWAGQSLGVV